jgi:hypothetical protein
MAVTGLARDGLTGPEQVHAVQAMLDLGLVPGRDRPRHRDETQNRESRQSRRDPHR